MKTILTTSLAAAAMLAGAATVQAQSEHSLRWHGPGILRGGDDDRGRIGGGRNYYVAPYYGGYGYSYGYPVYGVPYSYGGPVYGYPYGGYGYTSPGYGFPTYGYSYPGVYWSY